MYNKFFTLSLLTAITNRQRKMRQKGNFREKTMKERKKAAKAKVSKRNKPFKTKE